MKLVGGFLVVAGLILGGLSLGPGGAGGLAHEQNVLHFASNLSVVGAILMGYGLMAAKRIRSSEPAPAPREHCAASEPTGTCPECRSMNYW